MRPEYVHDFTTQSIRVVHRVHIYLLTFDTNHSFAIATLFTHVPHAMLGTRPPLPHDAGCKDILYIAQIHAIKPVYAEHDHENHGTSLGVRVR